MLAGGNTAEAFIEYVCQICSSTQSVAQESTISVVSGLPKYCDTFNKL